MGRYWIFDLDNTLHFADHKIFPQINYKMDSYIQTKLGINKQNSAILRQFYWDSYGATLVGLVKHHKIDAQDFLKTTHNIILSEENIIFPKNTRHIIKKIRAKKLIFTNAPKIYTKKILKHMKIYNFFNRIHSIEESNFHGKPNQKSFHKLFKTNKFTRGIMIDDVKENLMMAKKMGLITIWLTKEKYKPNFINYKISNLNQLRQMRIS